MTKPKLLTEAELESLFAIDAGETPDMVIPRWFKVINDSHSHLLAGGLLSEKQHEVVDFYREKISDWRSDYYSF